MDKLASTDNDPHNNYVIDEMDTTSLTNLQDHNDMNVNDNTDGSAKDNALTGANPGYADTQNTLDETVEDANIDRASLDNPSVPLEQDDSDTLTANLATTGVDDDQQDDGDISLENPDDHTLDDNSDDSLQQNGAEDDDMGTIEDEEETMEQGTVEESDIDDRLGSTLDEALEALVEATTSSPLVDSSSSSIIDRLPSSSLIGYHQPSTQLNTSSSTTSTTIGYDMDDFAMIDFSCWLYGAVFILICLRLPYVKRYFTRRNHQDNDSNATLPYHTIQNKELD